MADSDRRQQDTGSVVAGNGDSDWVILGRISGLYGVRGWVKVYSHTAPRENILDYPVWHLRQHGEIRACGLESGKAHGKGIVARLEGVDDRDRAAALLQAEILVPRAQLPEAGSDEYYWTDLEGLPVVNLQGVALGRVDHLFETGANDVMVVMGDRQRLIPFIRDVVLEVDLERPLLTVDWDPEF